MRPMKQAPRPALHRWTRHEYDRLIEHGFFDEDDPIELLDGLLLVKEPQSSPHRTAVLLAAKTLERPGAARRRWGYAAIETLGADAGVAPLAAPSARVRVADLLP